MLIEKAIEFATKAHSGQKRKLTGTPYILHPLEVASILANMSASQDLIIAAMLHDTIEDCGIKREEIESQFGPRVTELVLSETEEKIPGRAKSETWEERKLQSLEILRNTCDEEVKLLWLADKLSNFRSVYTIYLKEGDLVWCYFHQQDKEKQKWYYRKILEYTSDLKDTYAYIEFEHLFTKMFG